MPELWDRRRFLQQIGVSAALTSFAAQWSLAESASVIRFALLSDTHISRNAFDRFRGFSPHQNLAAVIDQVGAAHWDLLLVNGDLARLQGDVLDYLQFNSFLEPLAANMPVLLTLGNHDHRLNVQASLIKHAGDSQPVRSKLVSTIDTEPVRFILLDSLMTTNIAQGELGEAQRTWLASYLDRNSAKPIVVFVHHNPEAASLVDIDLLLALLKPKRAVKALIYGHRHIYRFDQVDDLHLINLPAVGYNFEDGNPVGWVESLFSPSGAEFRLHAVAGDVRDNGKITRVNWRSGQS